MCATFAHLASQNTVYFYIVPDYSVTLFVLVSFFRKFGWGGEYLGGGMGQLLSSKNYNIIYVFCYNSIHPF